MRQLKTAFAKETFNILYINDETEAKKVVKAMLKKYDSLGFDIETARKSEYIDHDRSGLDPHLSDIRLMQFWGGDEYIYVFDVWNMDIQIFKELLTSKRLIAHNAGFEIKFLLNEEINIAHCKCTQVMYELVKRAEIEEKFGDPRLGLRLVDAAETELGYSIPKDLQTSNWNANELTIGQIQYAALDAVLPVKIAEKLLPRIKAFKLGTIFNLTCNIQIVVAKMELNGLGFDKDYHDSLVAKWERDLCKFTEECKEYFGGINLGSPTQLSTWAKNNLDKDTLDLFTFTDSTLQLLKARNEYISGEKSLGKYLSPPYSEVIAYEEHPLDESDIKLSFNVKNLVAVQDHPAIAKYLEYKKTSGMVTKFGPNLSRFISPETKRIHSNFWITGTATGRMSSSKPNFQQMPNDREFRKVYIAREGYKLIGADYSQIETRIQGEYSQDPVMLNAYKNGIDLYIQLASELFNVPIESLNKESPERDIGKEVQLAFGYNMYPKTFINRFFQNTGKRIPLEQGQEYFDAYHRIYNVYSSWVNKVLKIAEKTGYAYTKLGRIRHLHPDYQFNTVANMYVQGTAAQVIYKAMEHLEAKGLEEFFWLAPVHDELLIEVREDYAEDYRKEMNESMIFGFTSIFPNGITRGLVDAKVGNTWADVH